MIKLSILIPSLPTRQHMVHKLYERLVPQMRDDVEVLVFTDNRKRSVGAKRESLKNLAQGLYFAFCDDDDMVSLDYINEIVNASDNGSDLITFNSKVFINGEEGLVEMSLRNKHNEQFKPGEITKRPPWHVCAWRTEKFQKVKFGDSNFGEDWEFCKNALLIAETETYINKPLHEYHYSDAITETQRK